jgi:hypothetical protein
MLNRQEFDEFIDKVDLHADRTQTLGSIGAPGFGYRRTPAISFENGRSGESVDAWLSAYVTPVPDFTPKHRGNDPDWEKNCWDRIKAAILEVYG